MQSTLLLWPPRAVPSLALQHSDRIIPWEDQMATSNSVHIQTTYLSDICPCLSHRPLLNITFIPSNVHSFNHGCWKWVRIFRKRELYPKSFENENWLSICTKPIIFIAERKFSNNPTSYPFWPSSAFLHDRVAFSSICKMLNSSSCDVRWILKPRTVQLPRSIDDRGGQWWAVRIRTFRLLCFSCRICRFSSTILSFPFMCWKSNMRDVEMRIFVRESSSQWRQSKHCFSGL